MREAHVRDARRSSGAQLPQLQMATGHRDPKTVQRYDHGRENLELKAINFVAFDESRPDQFCGGDDLFPSLRLCSSTKLFSCLTLKDQSRMRDTRPTATAFL